LQHFLCGRVQELGFRIDKPRNEPGARDAVDLRPLARDPARARVLRLVIERTTGRLPALLQPSFEEARVDARASESRRGLLAHFVTMDAIDDDAGGTGELPRQAGDF